MDRMNERIVDAKPDFKAYLSVAGSILIILIGIFLCLTITMYGLLIIVIGVYLFTFVKDGMRVEYEYTLTNGEIDVARILAKSRRKEIRTIEADKITRMDYADSDRTRNDLEVKKGQVAIHDYTGGDKISGKKVAIYYSAEDKEAIDLFDFDDSCITHMKEVLKSRSEIK